MGQPVRIADLAKRMISLMGLTVRDDDNPDGDIEIVYTGLRPAEKLFEELLIGNNVTGTEHPMIMRAMEHSLPWDAVQQVLDELLVALARFDCDRARAAADARPSPSTGRPATSRTSSGRRKALRWPAADDRKIADFAAKRAPVRRRRRHRPRTGREPLQTAASHVAARPASRLSLAAAFQISSATLFPLPPAS